MQTQTYKKNGKAGEYKFPSHLKKKSVVRIPDGTTLILSDVHSLSRC